MFVILIIEKSSQFPLFSFERISCLFVFYARLVAAETPERNYFLISFAMNNYHFIMATTYFFKLIWRLLNSKSFKASTTAKMSLKGNIHLKLSLCFWYIIWFNLLHFLLNKWTFYLVHPNKGSCLWLHKTMHLLFISTKLRKKNTSRILKTSN